MQQNNQIETGDRKIFRMTYHLNQIKRYLTDIFEVVAVSFDSRRFMLNIVYLNLERCLKEIGIIIVEIAPTNFKKVLSDVMLQSKNEVGQTLGLVSETGSYSADETALKVYESVEAIKEDLDALGKWIIDELDTNNHE